MRSEGNTILQRKTLQNEQEKSDGLIDSDDYTIDDYCCSLIVPCHGNKS
jgi:hypothetical protein